MLRGLRVAAVCGLILGGVLMLPNAAGAHESRTVGDGKYEVVVGFLDEPAFSGQKNGLELRVATTPDSGTEAGAAAGAPVEGLEQTLHAEVIYGDQSMPLTLQARFGQPGAYAGWFFPMAAGDYSFRIYGAIDGAAVDETFTSSPETFGAVEDPTPLQFPKPEGAETPGAVVGFMTGGTGWSGGVAALGLALSGGALALYRRGVADVSR